MIKKFLIFIVILSAIWAWPAGRAKLGQVLHPLLTHLGPLGRKAEAPMKKYAAKTQVAAIVNGIEHAREEGKDLPDPRTFSNWLRAHPLFDEKDIDPWGNAYFLNGQHPTFLVGSRGPDGVKGNADDISSTVTF
jgi:hypothetical protein